MTIKARNRLFILAGAVAALAVWWIRTSVCLPLLFSGLDVGVCPDGDVRQVASVEANNLMRGRSSLVSVRATGIFMSSKSVTPESRAVTRGEPSLALVPASGVEIPLARAADFKRRNEFFNVTVKVPEVPDGEYTLRARIKTAFGESQVDAPVTFLAPARVKVITDRPLYEPGHTIQFRSLVLRAADLAPLESRPGKWTVTDPGGLVVLEERAPTGPWGVSSGSFPLDRGRYTTNLTSAREGASDGDI